ncbi:MAG: hypothetical protein N3D20_01750 [Candidatus Pacearchaeota archaeon]|nr:hypothetical protein [Candidatus Pacearchaeota archaeon]
MVLFEIFVLISAIPIGYLIAYFANDELVAGRKWFKVLIVVALLMGIWTYYAGLTFITLTCIFIIIVTIVSLIKSKDRKWTRKRVR